MINEESGDELECPYCDDGWNCKHLVAAPDRSFLSLNGGALGG